MYKFISDVLFGIENAIFLQETMGNLEWENNIILLTQVVNHAGLLLRKPHQAN